MRVYYWMLACLLLSQGIATAQTKTTKTLDEKYEGLSLYFYKNTLRMLNQTDNPEFDEIVKDIEKMRFLMIDRGAGFSKADYGKLKSDYRKESYEEVLTGRIEDKNFDVYIRESGGTVKGTVILASDSSQLYVLDILGRVALDKVGTLFKTLDDNSDIEKKIEDFVGAHTHQE